MTETPRMIPLTQLKPWAGNPRKTFDDERLSGLAVNLKERGQLSSLVVRPSGDLFEVICGARRVRAAEVASWTELLCVVRELSDTEALETNISENDQREDVHPLEEADGYLALQREHDLTSEQIADQLGRPRQYVTKRLALTKLGKVARDFYLEGHLVLGTALVLTSISRGSVQDKAAKELASDADYMTVRNALWHVKSNYQQKLADAPWDLDCEDISESLSAADFQGTGRSRGACSSCPHRTHAQTFLFGADDEDHCLLGSCWDQKKKVHTRTILASARADGAEVLSGVDAKKVWPDRYAQTKGYIELDKTPDYSTSKTTRKVLGKRLEQVPRCIATNPHTGDVVELVRAADVKRVMRDEPRKTDPEKLSGQKKPLTPAEKRERTIRAKEKLVSKAKAKAHEAAITALVEGIHTRTLKVDVDGALRSMVERLCRGMASIEPVAKLRDLPMVKSKYGCDTCPELESFIARAKRPQLLALGLEVVLRGELDYHGHFMEGVGEQAGQPSAGQRILDLAGVDWLALEQAAVEEAQQAEAAKAAKKRPTRKTAKKPTKKRARVKAEASGG